MPALARATGTEGASFAGGTGPEGRATAGAGGAGETLGIIGGLTTGVLAATGATGAGRSGGCSTAGAGLRVGATGAVAGPAAAGGTAGFGAGGGGGGGATTALRAVALISAIDRVSGWSSLKSCSFFRSNPACGCGVSAGGAGGADAVEACPTCSPAEPPSPRKCARTLSARSSSKALEWDFLSGMPISAKYSRTTLLFTSNSRANSLILIFPMRNSISPLPQPIRGVEKSAEPVRKSPGSLLYFSSPPVSGAAG